MSFSCAGARSATPSPDSWTSRPRGPMPNSSGRSWWGSTSRESRPGSSSPSRRRYDRPRGILGGAGCDLVPRPARTSSSSTWPGERRGPSPRQARTPRRYTLFGRPARPFPSAISRASTSPTRGERNRSARSSSSSTDVRTSTHTGVPHPHGRRLQRRRHARRGRPPPIPRVLADGLPSPTWSSSTGANPSTAPRDRPRRARTLAPPARLPRQERGDPLHLRDRDGLRLNGRPRPQAPPARPRRDPSLRRRLPSPPPRQAELRFAARWDPGPRPEEEDGASGPL